KVLTPTDTVRMMIHLYGANDDVGGEEDMEALRLKAPGERSSKDTAPSGPSSEGAVLTA
ncbi:hypothetical protein BgiBS90_006762, partial [Biomphalaria glabrata]